MPNPSPIAKIISGAGWVLVLCLCLSRGNAEDPQMRDISAASISKMYAQFVPHTDKKGRRLKAYDPESSFFPIGIWGVPLHGVSEGFLYDWTELKKAGFNTVWAWRGEDRIPSLKAAEEFGFQAILMGSLEADFLKKEKDHPNLLGNMWDDEPMGKLGQTGFSMEEHFRAFQDYKTRTNQLAPDLLVFNNDVPWYWEQAAVWWPKWNAAGDIVCHDNYPFTAVKARSRSMGREPNGVPQALAMAGKVNDWRKPSWVIVGAFDDDDLAGTPFSFRFPTIHQLRAQVYASIIGGATGITYFTWDSRISRAGNVIGISPDPQADYEPEGRELPPGRVRATPLQMIDSKALWAAASEINGELRDLAPAILSKTAGGEMPFRVEISGEAVTETPIRCLLKADPRGGYLLFTVNLDDAVIPAKFTFPQGLSAVQNLYENAPPTEIVDGQSFAVLFEPFASHVIRLK